MFDPLTHRLIDRRGERALRPTPQGQEFESARLQAQVKLLLLHFVEGYTYREISRELGLSESAAKMRVSRGSKQLRELFEQRTQQAERTGATAEAADG